MSRSNDTARTRRGALALVAAGVLFLLYQVTRPYSDETTLDGAEAIASGAWIASHLFAVIGFTLLALSLLALHIAVRETAVERLAFRALVVTWVGVMLTTTYYGAEIFGLNAVAQRAADTGDTTLIGLFNEIRYIPAAITVFGIGLLVLAAGAVMAALAIRRSGILPRWSGVPMAVGLALYLPQFFTPPAVRMAHGLLLAAGCAWVALAMWRLRNGPGIAPSVAEPARHPGT